MNEVQTQCVCGHIRADHHHEKYPLSSECFADDCDCTEFKDVREVIEEAFSGEPTPETNERPIREDIKVGATLFRAGVKLRIVLERIERGFKYHTNCSTRQL